MLHVLKQRQLRFLAVLLLALPVQAGAAPIDILQARFGDLMGSGSSPPCDATQAVSQICQGTADCHVPVEAKLCLVPASDDPAAQLSVNYDCGGQGTARFNLAAAGSIMEIACSGPAAAAPANAQKRPASTRPAAAKRAAVAKPVRSARTRPPAHPASTAPLTSPTANPAPAPATPVPAHPVRRDTEPQTRATAAS